MKKQLALLGALAVVGGVAMPANAADKGEMLTTVAMVPVKTVALVTGAVFGTPVAVVRKVTEESIDATKTVAHSDSPFMLGAASVIGVPIGVFKGGIEGLWLGSYNSYSNNDKPFCLESFSMGDMGEGEHVVSGKKIEK